MDGFDVQAMGYVAPVILKRMARPQCAVRTGIRRGAVRHFGRFAVLQHARGQNRTPPRADHGHAVLFGADVSHGSSGERATDAGDPLHRRDGAGRYHAERGRAGRRIQPAQAARHHHDDRGQWIHGRRGLWRFHRGLADSTLRMALGLLFRRGGSAGDRRHHDFRAAGIAAVPGAASQASGTGRALAEADRSKRV